MQRSLSLSQGNLIRTAVLRTAQRPRLMMVIHHLVVDGVSWRVLLEDLQRAYGQLSRGEVMRLDSKTSSYQKWGEDLRRYAQSEELQAEAGYWMSREEAEALKLPVEKAGTGDRPIAPTIAVEELDEQETHKLLKRTPEVYHTQINDVLLTALAGAVYRWAGGESGAEPKKARVRVDLEGHGRQELSEDLDLSRTVGWFTALYPMALEVRADEGLGKRLKRIKEELRGVPRGGIGYGALKYLREDETGLKLRECEEAEISFNYLGQTDQALGEEMGMRVARESIGATAGPSSRRSYPLDVLAVVSGGRLRVAFSASQRLKGERGLGELAGGYIRELKDLIRHCLEEAKGGHTPSDFDLVKVGQEKLDELESRGEQIEEIYNLSPLQEGLLFHSVYEEGSGLYVVQHELIGLCLSLQQSLLEFFVRLTVHATHLLNQHFSQVIQTLRYLMPDLRILMIVNTDYDQA